MDLETQNRALNEKFELKMQAMREEMETRFQQLCEKIDLGKLI